MFREKDNVVYVDCYAIELYLPYDYLDKEYRGIPYYTVIGTKVQYFGVGNMKFFNSQKEMENPLSVPIQTLGVPMILITEPSDIDTRDVVFTKGGKSRKCIVLTYYKDDQFLCDMNAIKRNECDMILMSRLEGGKLDHTTPEEAFNILNDSQRMNGVSLRVPPEELEIFVSERYRMGTEDGGSQRLRMADSDETDVDMDDIVSLNMRQEAMNTTTYQALTHEDINSALISSVNRTNRGVVDDPTIMERVVRGMDMSDLIEERDKRWAAEAAVEEKLEAEHNKNNNE